MILDLLYFWNKLGCVDCLKLKFLNKFKIPNLKSKIESVPLQGLEP